MTGHTVFKTAAGLAILLAGLPAFSQTRTPWTMHDGLEVTSSNPLGLVPFNCSPTQHGQICEYDVATIPMEGDPGWRPAPNGETIGFSFYPSRVCQAPITCLAYGDFTYFQTFVNVPGNVVVTQFTIAFSGMDDGSRVTIFNSQYPGGLVVPGSYVYLGGTGTADLGPYVRSGEINRVVITQVDDCCIENNLHSAVVVLNGEEVDPGCNGPADCNDGNACTEDVCNADGSCSNPGLSCDDGNACTADSCNPATGCFSVNQCPDCSGAMPAIANLWPPNHKFVPVGVVGISDPQGQTATIRIDGIAQDEPTNTYGDGDFCPDGAGIGASQALVRAERSGTRKVPGDGRVYHISFTATDPDGYSCTGTVSTCVPHDQGGRSMCVDQGALYNSLMCVP